jgi:sarcosine oxidase
MACLLPNSVGRCIENSRGSTTQRTVGSTAHDGTETKVRSASTIDVVVVGAGLAGAATAWAATRRGLSVTVVEQFDTGHARGSSHGSARIFRRAYDDPLYVRLTGRARELWRALEADAGEQLLRPTGGIDHGPGRHPERIAAQFRSAGVHHELLPAAEAATRWPGMRFDGPVLFHPEAGVIDADRAVGAFLAAAVRRGADHRPQTRVDAVDVSGDVAVVRIGDERIVAGCAVIAVGAWLEPFLAGTLTLPPLRVTQQQLFHFARLDPAVAWPTMVHTAALEAYGLDSGRDTAPVAAYKVGEHDNGTPTTAADRSGAVDPSSRARMVDYVRRYLPGLEPEPLAEATCLYTATPTEDFVLDRQGPLVICSTCSGHGAKFAPLTGELATDLVVGRPVVDGRFRLPA